MTRVPGVASGHASTREFTLTRVFDAPRDLVYQVWTNPRYVSLWWGVEGADNPVCELDVRPGGQWRIDMRMLTGVIYPNAGEFVEVVENERLVYTDRSDPDSPAWKGATPPGDRLNVVTFEDEGVGTRVTLCVKFKSVADRTFFEGAGMKRGIGQSLDRLGRVLETLR